MRLIHQRIRTALVCALASTALGQSSQITGLILDESNRPIPNAEVVVRNYQTGARRVALSNGFGVYAIPSLSSGTYRIIVSAAGFETAIHEPAFLEVSQSGRLDFTLRLPRRMERITVTAPSPVFSPTDASVGTLVNRDYIARLPLSGRGIQMLITLAPGVVLTPVNFFSLAQQSANGQRPNTAYTTVDGICVNFGTVFKGFYQNILNVTRQAVLSGPSQAISGSIPALSIFGTFSSLASIDNIEEFRIQTSTFSPEYGRTPGPQISIVTRSGTKRLSGSIFEYLRNEALNADEWLGYYPNGKPKVRYHDFGGSLGGPLRLHRSDAEPGNFFFFSWENTYLLQPGSPRSDIVPSLDARRAAPQAVLPLYQAFPLPTGIVSDGYNAGAAAVALNYPRPSKLRTYSLRIDRTLESKGNLYARYSGSASTAHSSAGNDNPANSMADELDTQLAIVGWNRIVGTKFVNEFRFGAGRQAAYETFRIDSVGGAVPPPSALLFPPGVSKDDSLISYGNAVQVGKGSANQSRQLQVLDNASIKIGSHLVKAGWDYRWLSPIVAGPRLELRTDWPSDEGHLSFVTATARAKMAIVTPMASGFAQDVWQIRQKLTLTYGIRWEVNPAPRGKNGTSLLTVGGFSDFGSLSQLYPLETRRPLYPTKYSDIGPRFGLALRLAQQNRGQTILRAGGGLYYDVGHDGFSNMTLPPLWISRAGDVPFPLSAVIAAPPPNRFQDTLFSNAIAVLPAPGFRLPRTDQWNIAVQQSYEGNLLSAAYVGAIGRGLLGQGMLGSAGVPTTQMVIAGNNGSSIYNALQLQFTRRLNRGVQALVSYAWAHSIDDVPNVVGSLQLKPSDNSLVPPLNEYLTPRINRGDSDFDIRHGISGAVVLQLDQGNRVGIISNLTRNWIFNFLGFARTPPPSNVLAPASCSFCGPDPRRPDLVSGQPVYIYGSYPGGKWLNANAFAAPKGAQGTLGRNALRLFGAWQLDFSVHRDFRIKGATKVQLRAEFFNILNHPNYANPTDLSSNAPSPFCFCGNAFATASESLARGLSSVSHGGLDPIFQTGGPRSGQLAFRISF